MSIVMVLVELRLPGVGVVVVRSPGAGEAVQRALTMVGEAGAQEGHFQVVAEAELAMLWGVGAPFQTASARLEEAWAASCQRAAAAWAWSLWWTLSNWSSSPCRRRRFGSSVDEPEARRGALGLLRAAA